MGQCSYRYAYQQHSTLRRPGPGSGNWGSLIITLAMNYRFTVHFSTSFSTTKTSFRQNGAVSLADIATLGFAFSLMPSASFALAVCFLVCFLSTVPHDVTAANRLQVNLD